MVPKVDPPPLDYIWQTLQTPGSSKRGYTPTEGSCRGLGPWPSGDVAYLFSNQKFQQLPNSHNYHVVLTYILLVWIQLAAQYRLEDRSFPLYPLWQFLFGCDLFSWLSSNSLDFISIIFIEYKYNEGSWPLCMDSKNPMIILIYIFLD